MNPSRRSDLSFATGRGALTLIALAVLGGCASLMPLRGDLLGLLTGIGGALAVTLILPQPERHPLLALGWATLSFTLPVALVLTDPGLPLGASFAMGAAGFWAILSLAAARRLHQG